MFSNERREPFTLQMNRPSGRQKRYRDGAVLFDRRQVAGFALFADNVFFETVRLAQIFIIVRATAI
jgi:hypothetical protein